MKLHIVAGGQFGSEGKGAFTAQLVKRIVRQPDGSYPVLVRVAGPNAGHTAYDAAGQKWALRQIPVGAVVDHRCPIVIGQQSEIDLAVLEDEVVRLEQAGIPIIDRLVIDYNATVIEGNHRAMEANIETGTTGKGIGAARAARALRTASRVRDLTLFPYPNGDTVRWLRGLADTQDIIVEGTQGYGLGAHTRFYPYSTSTNCRPGDFLAMTGLQPWDAEEIIPWLVFRVHPIRIAGDSGPLVNETTWETISQPTEYTTVTQKPRRVGNWDQQLATEAITAAGGPEYVNLAVNFIDYVWKGVEGETTMTPMVEQAFQHLLRMVRAPSPQMFQYLGTGPDTGVWIND